MLFACLFVHLFVTAFMSKKPLSVSSALYVRKDPSLYHSGNCTTVLWKAMPNMARSVTCFESLNSWNRMNYYMWNRALHFFPGSHTANCVSKIMISTGQLASITAVPLLTVTHLFKVLSIDLCCVVCFVCEWGRGVCVCGCLHASTWSRCIELCKHLLNKLVPLN